MPADPNLPGREDNTMSPPPSGITLQMLERHFDKNLKDAARDLGVGMTTLKRTCRHFGIAKWPRRTLKCKREKLQEALETLRSEGAATASPDGRVGVTIDGAFHGVNVCARGFAMIPGRPLDRMGHAGRLAVERVAARREAPVAHEPAVRHRAQAHVLGAPARAAAHRGEVD